MKSSTVFDADVVLNDERIPRDSLWIRNTCSPASHGTASMVNLGERSERSMQSESCDDELESCFHHRPEKKRRLTAEQVQFLEKSFAAENKLEPDRKTELAKKLGLQPRQVAIWFQNRRARSKTKLLEREYGSLKSCYDKLKADYDALFLDNQKLRNEVDLLLSEKLGNDRISPVDEAPCKQEDASSYSYSSHVVDQGDEDDECLVQPKLEAQYYEYDDHLQPNSCNLGFPVQNQGTWFWQC